MCVLSPILNIYNRKYLKIKYIKAFTEVFFKVVVRKNNLSFFLYLYFSIA